MDSSDDKPVDSAVEEAEEVYHKLIKIREKDIPKLIEVVERLCSSDQLALTPLKEKIKIISTLSSPFTYPMLSSRMLLNACSNKNITIEIVECILDVCRVNRSFFSSESNTRLTAIHMACTNNDCPTSVIELLIKKDPSAPEHWAVLGDFGIMRSGTVVDVQGLPLHFYLSRKASCIDVEAVKKLVNAFPEALTTLLPASNNEFTTLSVLLYHREIDDLVNVFRILVELNPSAVQLRDSAGFTPLHTALCSNKINSIFEIIQLLLEVWPDGVDGNGFLPIHTLCINYNEKKDGGVLLDIARTLLNTHPDSLRQNNHGGYTPLHLAAARGALALCQLLISYDSELVNLLSGSGLMPFHTACANAAGNDTVRYLFELYPECIHIRDYGDYLPIHLVIRFYYGRERSQILRFLLECHPDSASESITAGVDGLGDPIMNLPLHLACIRGLRLKDLMMVFNAYPEAINMKDGQGKIPSDYLPAGNDDERSSFMSRQLEYATMAEDIEVMTTADANERLPLHTALYDSECLGGIKLLLKGYPEALQLVDSEGLYPLHISCMKGLLDIVRYLLEEEASVVSKRTYDGKLPVHLLCESSDGSLECTDAIWNLLVTYPEAVMIER